jgi:hypothetical protein
VWSEQALVFFLNELSALLFADTKPKSGCTRSFFHTSLPSFGFPSRSDKLEVLTQLLASDAVSVDTARALAVHWAALGVGPTAPGVGPAADTPLPLGKKRGSRRSKKPKTGDPAGGPPAPASGDHPRRKI